MTLPSAWQRLQALTMRERWALLVASAQLPLVWLGLRIFGLMRLRAFLLRAPVTAPRTVGRNVQSLARIVNAAAARSPFPVTCLTRSLLLERWLRRDGIAAELRIGVQRNGGHLNAHAWVECAGEPINDRADIASAFIPFDDLTPASALHYS